MRLHPQARPRCYSLRRDCVPAARHLRSGGRPLSDARSARLSAPLSHTRVTPASEPGSSFLQAPKMPTPLRLSLTYGSASLAPLPLAGGVGDVGKLISALRH